MRQGNVLLITVLVLVALIPICVYILILNRNKSADYQIRNAALLSDKSITAQIREIKDYDKDGKEIRYWVVDLASHLSESLFNCYVAISSKGEQQLFYGFSRKYTNKNCNLLIDTRQNYECRLSNSINKFKNSDISKRWDRLVGNGHLVIGVASFYREQTIADDSFYHANRLTDIYSVISSCQNPKGSWVRQEILNPPLIPLPN